MIKKRDHHPVPRKGFRLGCIAIAAAFATLPAPSLASGALIAGLQTLSFETAAVAQVAEPAVLRHHKVRAVHSIASPARHNENDRDLIRWIKNDALKK